MAITATAAAAITPISTLRIRILWPVDRRPAAPRRAPTAHPAARALRHTPLRRASSPGQRPGGTLSLDDLATNAALRYRFGRCLSHELEGLVGAFTADVGAAPRPGPAVVV